jgi:hypothetical protein
MEKSFEECSVLSDKSYGKYAVAWMDNVNFYSHKEILLIFLFLNDIANHFK